MADNEVHINGINGDSIEFVDADQTSKNPNFTIDADQTPKNPNFTIDALNKRIEVLELENSSLVEENSKISELKREIESLTREKEETSEKDAKAIAAIAKRASELEGEATRLREDLVLSMNENSESSFEILALKEKINELNGEIDVLKSGKELAEDSVAKLRLLLNESKEKVKVMEDKMEELAKKLSESEKMVGGLMEKIAENGRETETRTAVGDEEGEKGWKGGLHLQLPVIGAVSAGAVVAVVALLYVRSAKNG